MRYVEHVETTHSEYPLSWGSNWHNAATLFSTFSWHANSVQLYRCPNFLASRMLAKCHSFLPVIQKCRLRMEHMSATCCLPVIVPVKRSGRVAIIWDDHGMCDPTMFCIHCFIRFQYFLGKPLSTGRFLPWRACTVTWTGTAIGFGFRYHINRWVLLHKLLGVHLLGKR